MAFIRAEQLSLTFHVRRTRHSSFKEYVLNGLLKMKRNPMMENPVLREIDFELNDGDRLGVIGHNGAGKSTLLKTLAGIYPPSNGRVVVDGKISSIFDLLLGFEAEANAWDNIRYRALLQGETPKTIQAKLQAVADFSELGEFLDVPVRYYSAGMLVRLAFSIASMIEPEILLIDEALGAGDMSFQLKARERMRELMKRSALMVLVSHDLETISNICNRVIWIDHGRIIADGPANTVVRDYIRKQGIAA
jgi:lipopolysaccharide transport system ATP-binding protein